MIIPVILSGGSGSRLWPLSREMLPKQLQKILVTESSFLRQTLARLQGFEGISDPLIVCNDQHRFLVREQLEVDDIGTMGIILEPFGRNTAPAVAIAALHAISREEDPLLLVMPSDHLIGEIDLFHGAVEKGLEAAKAGGMVTFGIPPKSPETGFGYVKKGAPLGADGIFKVERFKEKPDLETAREYLATGDYLWNSGIFLFRAKLFLEELNSYEPQMFQKCKDAYNKVVEDIGFLRLEKESFAQVPGNSIDYAVMEKTDNAVVVSLDAQWSDVGSWSAIWDLGKKDDAGNILEGDVLAQETKDSLLLSTSRLLTTVGVEGHVIVETPDAVLVVPKDRVQEVKDIVSRLKAAGRPEATQHRKVYRPWGSYEEVNRGERYQVKHIIVKPGSSLSLQLHHHRAEHWIVVRGTARITRGDEVFQLTENQSTYIPVGVRHRLENPGRIPIELIEVQNGSYLGEDDIVRFEDSYGREEKE